MIASATLEFLTQAACSSDTAWLQENRGQLALARSDLVAFAERLITDAGAVDSRIRDANTDPRKCLARALTKGSATITLRASPIKNAAATYFVEIAPRCSFSGGGARLPPPRLARILLQTIASQTGKWRAIVEGPLFMKFFPNGLSDGRNMTSNGYVKNHDALDFFNLRNFGACRAISDETLVSSHLLEESVKSFAAARPLVDYINRATTRLT
jgi:uncharacterized protein (TIGR02453 family)